jgi:hypothetical protein
MAHPKIITAESLKNKSINQIYEIYCKTRSDIYRHLPTLREYSEKSVHVTEMGVRKGVSTAALLSGRPKKLISYDINLHEEVFLLKKIAENEGLSFDYQLGDSTKIKIEQTDLLFIDTNHVYEQLRLELALHHQKVNKYIIMHDTKTFGRFRKKKRGFDRHGQLITGLRVGGLTFAIKEFLKKHNEWVIKEEFTKNNGLTILEKI